MSLSTTLLVAWGLAMDAFAVSLAAGLAIETLTPRHVFRAAFHFGLFQALMPILGWFLGSTVADTIGAFDHWLAFGLLAGIGGKMLWESREAESAPSCADPTRGWSLITLSVATSIDALAVGLSVAMLRVTIWGPALLIGVITCALSTIGILLGHRVGCRWGRWAELLGGLVLIGIGTRILISHLT